jgi:SAM-dependent methyltransferase
VHGYEPRERTRLEDQAATLETLLHCDTVFAAGSRVLEVGCGVGAQTLTLARQSPGAEITAVDISAESLAAAAARLKEAGLSIVEFVQADIYDLPFSPASFDHLFVCFVLEHLPRPIEALLGLMRFLGPGGTATIIEGDHGTTCFYPESAAARAAVGAMVALQEAADGDPNIGRTLYPLLKTAGFEQIHVSPRTVYIDGCRPDLAESFTRRTFTAMVEGVRDQAVEFGLIDPQTFDEGVSGLRRTAEPDGVFYYTFFKATAKMPGPDQSATYGSGSLPRSACQQSRGGNIPTKNATKEL